MFSLSIYSQEVSGLHNCLQLQKLYLFDNHISEIANLELLVNLEVLWLNSNHITKTEVTPAQQMACISYPILIQALTKHMRDVHFYVRFL